MQISYGYEIQEESDPFLKLADEAAGRFIQSTTPGAFLVNILPILRHIPDWFPRAEFKRTAKEWRSTLHEVVEQPYNYAKQQIAAGDTRYSFTSSQLKGGRSNDKEFDIRWTAATLYTGQFNNNHLHARNTTAGSDRCIHFRVFTPISKRKHKQRSTRLSGMMDFRDLTTESTFRI
ncbi:uncharacterized protein ARMOST_06372 [Armillaria ostoyae]|uniref:Uncharacterized protein n=1 Tax=Armillaria ostoyae TaxID=47428 RepID=A0A284R2S7_ARMOS|nr:uncharacterized protein ARMOST_06372 [Armillaria ostoyae]